MALWHTDKVSVLRFKSVKSPRTGRDDGLNQFTCSFAMKYVFDGNVQFPSILSGWTQGLSQINIFVYFSTLNTFCAVTHMQVTIKSGEALTR